MARKSQAQVEAEAKEMYEEMSREVERRVQGLLPGIVAGLAVELAKTRHDLGPAAAPVTAESQTGTKSILEGLAHAMAKASDPANKRRILAPEIVQERTLAREEMARAIIRYHAAGQIPVYRVLRATFLNETLIHPQFLDPVSKAMIDQEIDWPGVPNQAMDPVNDEAKVVHDHYLKSIGARAGHVLMGFKLEGDNIEPSAVAFENLSAPLVLTGKEIRRGHAGAPLGAASINDALAADPRRGNPAAKPKVTHVLGTTAQPAVVS